LQSAASSAKNITAFSINGYIGTIDETLKTINITVPEMNLSSLTPVFTNSVKSTVTVGGIIQTSGVSINNFNSVVNYVVTAEDNSYCSYKIYVHKVITQLNTYNIVGNTIRGLRKQISFTTFLSNIVVTNGVQIIVKDKNGNVVNTVGAGDSLLSAFVHFYVKENNPYEALKKAIIFAANKIRFNGGASGFINEEEVLKQYKQFY
jgi:hypothetical protein